MSKTSILKPTPTPTHVRAPGSRVVPGRYRVIMNLHIEMPHPQWAWHIWDKQKHRQKMDEQDEEQDECFSSFANEPTIFFDRNGFPKKYPDFPFLFSRNGYLFELKCLRDDHAQILQFCGFPVKPGMSPDNFLNSGSQSQRRWDMIDLCLIITSSIA